ncbi:hypothetical protein [Bacillus thuringiensis]|uniref:Lactococcin 972 family bacteriocin n=1 Tax=Bacillus thuringiensis subsp. jegathesan TaxID=56955 RepID=A0A9X6QXI2_BACTJ|nr:hypothetical protein [Bacillus thuringiensis]OUB63550.1 hypothetical protein BK750_20200 [Bacillus thuringiensis serovar jegathesan]
MNFKKGIQCAALAATLVSGISILPASAGAETLGWSEDTGYTDLQYATYDGSQTLAASSKPEKHTAKKSYGSLSSSSVERVTANTTWKGVRHYSRARYENRSNNVKADSQRKYGVGTSEATSGWIDRTYTTYVAKTYWGN